MWPVAPTRTPSPATAPGSPPILVIGTTQDPATPYAWVGQPGARAQSGSLADGGRERSCLVLLQLRVHAYVQTYLISLTTPPVGRPERLSSTAELVPSVTTRHSGRRNVPRERKRSWRPEKKH